MTIKTVNPATGAVIAEYETMSDAAVDAAIAASAEAQLAWRKRSVAERAKAFVAVAALLRGRAEEYAQLMAAEMGKPLAEGRSEVEKCAKCCDYYIEHAETHLATREVPLSATARGKVVFRPLGVIFAVMPWNYPFWQVLRFAIPTLIAGNGAVLKHASNVTGSALALEKLCADAGLPKNLFKTLVISHKQSEYVIRHPAIRGVSLTGSEGAGRKIGAIAGEALKKVVLELGGSDAYLVLEDADVALAARHCVAGRYLNAGQSCVAAKRFIVVDAVREPFEAAVVAEVAKVKFGSPVDPEVKMGPMARVDLRDELHGQVMESLRKGARAIAGAEIPPGGGAFYPPTVLVDVVPGMPAYNDELFGPVASVIYARDEDDAIRLANDSDFGLGGAIFTANTAHGEALAMNAMESGMVAVNQQLVSDPRLPFGGIKNSGIGREVGEFGIMEFVNVKTIVIAS